MKLPVLKTIGDLSTDNHTSTIPVSNAHRLDRSVKPEIKRKLSLSDVFSILWRRKWTLLFSILLAMIVALFFTLSLKSTYRANATLQIERINSELINIANSKHLNGNANNFNDPFFRTRYETLKSRKMLSQVISDTHLQSSLTEADNSIANNLQVSIKKLLGFTETKSSGSLSFDYPDLLSQRLTVQPIDNSHLVKIYYEGNSPQEAKAVVSSLVHHFIKSQLDAHSETRERVNNHLKKQVDETHQRLRRSEEKLLTYSNAKGILGIDENQTRHVAKLNQLNQALVQAEIARSAAESEYKEAQRNGNGRATLNNPVIVNLKARVMGLESQYQEKLKLFKPSYPDMLQLNQQIIEVRRKLSIEARIIKNATNSTLKSSYLSAKSQESRLRNELARFNKELLSLQNNGIDYNHLKRAVESNSFLYKRLLQRAEEASILSLNTSNIKVIDPAVTPIKKYAPNPSFNIMAGLMSGLLLGLGLAFWREAVDQSVHSTEDLQLITGLPVLGLIPKPKKIKPNEMAKATILKPSSPFSEAYRILSANVRFTLVRQRGKVLLITSCSPNEGKTTTACNMAFTYAQMGMKVLLIDADMRKPSIAKKLNIYNQHGLSDYLSGDEDLLNVTQQIRAVNSLYVIPSGNHSDDVMGMISGERMQSLICQAQQKFDFIVVDSAPVGGFADTLLLSSLVSSTLIVADEEKLHIAKIRYTIEQLMHIKSTVVGFLLLNSTNPLVTDHHYEKHYQKNNPSFLPNALSHASVINFLLNDKTDKTKKIKVRGVKKPFWGKPRKGINLGYMN
jgi:capsular exopolysaccharide synthesis family protein